MLARSVFFAAVLRASEGMDLSQQFETPFIRQQGGTCHIFSTAALYEAACFRKTGAKVQLSEAVLFAKHLEETWSGPIDEFVITHEGNLTRKTGIANWASPLAPPNSLYFTGMDGGDPRQDLQ